MKQAIIIRTDIGMSKGKIAGQVAHAAVSSAESIRKYCPEISHPCLIDCANSKGICELFLPQWRHFQKD